MVEAVVVALVDAVVDTVEEGEDDAVLVSDDV